MNYLYLFPLLSVIFYSIILICINTTHYDLKRREFKKYCEDTRNLFLDLYPWYPITPTLHKVLEHAADCEEEIGLRLGVVSEGGAENQHRIRKLIRRFRARKTSRKDNLTDVLNRCLILSDPVLATKYSPHLEEFRAARREHHSKQIPEAAQNLLKIKKLPRVRETRAGRNIEPVNPEDNQIDPSDIEDVVMDEAEDIDVSDIEDGSSDDEGEWLGDDFLDE